MKENKTNIGALFLGILGAIIGLIVALLAYLLFTVLNRYSVYLLAGIFAFPFLGYCFPIMKIKDKKSEVYGDAEKINEIEKGASNFYKSKTIFSKIEMITGVIIVPIIGLFGTYFAEVLSLTYYIWRQENGSGVPLFEIFKYSLTGVFENKSTSGYIYLGWVGATAIVVITVGCLIYQKIKNKKQEIY